MNHALPAKSAQHSEKTRFAEMNLVVFSIMLSTVAPLRFELSLLQAITTDTGSRPANITAHILNNTLTITGALISMPNSQLLSKQWRPALEIHKPTPFDLRQCQRIKSKPTTVACNAGKS